MIRTHDADRLVSRLAAFPEGLRAVCAIVTDEDALWPPPDAPAPAWSIAQIALHLLLEERQDFRPRLLSTIRDPSSPWSPIDPERAVAERWGSERGADSSRPPLASILTDFARERANSILLLRALPRDDSIWARTHEHPRLGPLSAGQLLACWGAHDALHLRQISKRLHQLAQRDANSLDLSYAGSL